MLSRFDLLAVVSSVAYSKKKKNKKKKNKKKKKKKKEKRISRVSEGELQCSRLKCFFNFIKARS